MKYEVIYLGGEGKEYDDGIWTLYKTPKRIIAEKIEESGVFDNHIVGEKIRIGHNTGNPIKNEEKDGSFTVYFNQAGTPYIFTPLI